ncbi:MAG: phosphatase PAP2 family protein [candidate division Zixibacteria bacterium]|nr:phosphatase PAP2 family protein [candidate division Zixibacteria bacterium]
MKILQPLVATLIILLCGLPSLCLGGDDYLSGGEITIIGTGSAAVGVLGHIVYQIDVEDKSRIKGPLPQELSFHKFIAGNYVPGRTNILDNKTGSAITPILFGSALLGADLTWPVADKNKNAAQDIYLFFSGLIATKGITDFTKGMIRRPRPFTMMADSAVAESDKNYKYMRTSFFSGHSSSAFFSASFLNLRIRSIMRNRLSGDEYRNWRWAPPTLFFGWATYVAWSRVHAYQHYPSDVAVGALVGYLVSELFYSWARHENKTGATAVFNAPMLQFSFRF